MRPVIEAMSGDVPRDLGLHAGTRNAVAIRPARFEDPHSTSPTS